MSHVDVAVAAVEQFFELQKYLHQAIFRILPFSAGDLLYLIAALLFMYFVYSLFKSKNRLQNTFMFLVVLNGVYLVYQLFWGMLYFQKPMVEALPKEEISLHEVQNLANIYLEKTNESRALVNQDENGIYKAGDLNTVVEDIQIQQSKIPHFSNKKISTGIAPMKPSLYSKILSYTGILGYYNPFTAEGQYNYELPPAYLIFTLSHESAHQLGYAREQEASFVAFLCGEKSDNPDLQHSTNWYVLKSLMRYIETRNPYFNKILLNKFSPALERDMKFEKNFFEKKQSFLIAVFHFTNDLFLKTNQQEGSVTYNYFVELFVRYERVNKRIASKDTILKTQMMKKNLLPSN